MTKYGIKEDILSPQLVIAIGGDGSFIKALKETNFNINSSYVGIHTGHLGFLQEVQEEQIDEFFNAITKGEYRTDTLSIEEIDVISGDETFKMFALNEMALREKDLKTIKFEMFINNRHLEKFAGDGVLISTPTGSTAYNLSLGGSIIYPSLSTLQILPLAPITSRAYMSLRNGVIVPENMTISIIPEFYYRDKIKLIVDGENIEFDYVNEINVTTSKERIKVLRFDNFDFWTRVNEKFLRLED